MPLHVGWRGDRDELNVYWHADERVWSFFKSRWSAYGIDDPKVKRSQSLICQIDPPMAGFNRRYAGVFLRDDHDRVYVAHSGKIGGGRKGIGKDSFLYHYRGPNRQKVTWPDGLETETVVIGRLDSPRLVAQVGQFVNEVARIKRLVVEGSPVPSKERRAPSFHREFRGARASYEPSGSVESTCDHGLVVDALRQAFLDRYGLEPANDLNRDLYIPSGAGHAKVLFEVKTDTASGSIYQAIGQLFFHGAAEPRMPKLVAVVPAAPDARTAATLAKLGIRVAHYDWKGKSLRFPNLRAALK
jgi:hypothetical protein